MRMLIVLSCLFLIAGIPFVVVALVRLRRLPSGPFCPACLGETLWLRGPLLRHRRLRRLPPLQRRWCPACGWEGLARPHPAAAPPAPVLPHGSHDDDEAPPVAAPGQVAPADAGMNVELREVTTNGEAFRALLRCRAEGRAWHGRLVFVDRTGTARAERVEAFHGASIGDLLAQALALPEHSLARRLRRALPR